MIDLKNRNELKTNLDLLVQKFNQPVFIDSDPISIPHQFNLKQDMEISAFWTAILSWGQRRTILNKANELVDLMDHSPYDFILNHRETDRKRFENFKHRTFNYTDTLYFLDFLQFHYHRHASLEDAFLNEGLFKNIKESLIHFHDYFFSLPYAPERTRKHIPTPFRNSACKRLNMFLRWMVRKDDQNVDFGIWKRIPINGLMIPLDVHVDRMSRKYNLLTRKQGDWKAVEELTRNLRHLDDQDPVKYDFALFGLGTSDNGGFPL